MYRRVLLGGKMEKTLVLEAKRNPYSNQTKKEEMLNVITHSIGIGLSISALVLLVVYAVYQASAWKIVSVSIYGSSLIILYTVSTIYHIVKKDNYKQFLQLLDHCSIFLLIAGSYTPFVLVNLRDAWGWSLFGVVWAIAIAGIALKIKFGNRYEFVMVILYLVMGWLVVVAIKPLLSVLSVMGFVWLGVGGLSYSLGVIFFMAEKIPYHHAIWHLFVLGGSICQFFSIFYHVIPV